MPAVRRGDPLGGRNPAVVEASRLHRTRHRRERGQTLIEGPNLLMEALQAGVAVRSVFARPGDATTFEVCERQGIEALPVGKTALTRLADTESPRGPVAVIDIPVDVYPTAGNLLVAYGISDPGNMGALIRTAAAFGWGLAHTPGSADPWAPKVLRAGAGGHFKTSISPIGGLGDIDDRSTVAMVVRSGVRPDEIGGEHLAVLVGEEASGLPAQVVERCDQRLTIPMPGAVESLNAAAAAAIAVYALSQRHHRH